jgi:HEAT repeat protein
VRTRVRAVKDYAKLGDEAISKVAPFVHDADAPVRVEAVKALVDLGGPKTLDALIAALADNDAEVQARAAEGIVNVYLPGYVKTGFTSSMQRAGNSIKGKFNDTYEQVIDEFVKVRPDAIAGLGKIARGGSSLEARAVAARAVGVLRGRAAIPDLVEALRSKDDQLMFESLIAIQKIGDPSAAPRISFLLRDLEEKIQIEALETTGVLKNRDAAPQVRDALENARTVKIRRAALEALAMIADPADRTQFRAYLADKDDGLRAAALEGLARLKVKEDRDAATKAFNAERSMSPRVAAAFAMVSIGDLDTSRYSALRYLVNTLNQRGSGTIATAYVIELARDLQVRQAIYSLLPMSSKDEKIKLSIVLAKSADRDALPYLEALSTDMDPDVAAEGIRSLRTLRARLP